MKTCNVAYEPLVRDVVAEVLGTQQVSLTPVPTYPDSVVYEATGDGRSVVFKAVDPEGRDRDGVGLEAWACDRAADLGIPVPRVLVLDTSSAVFPSAYFVMEKVGGRPVDGLELPRADRERVTRDVGECLSRLHDARLPGFGWLDEEHHRATGEIRGSRGSWRAWLLDEVPAALDHLVERALSTTQAQRLRDAVARVESVLPDPRDARLLHGDLGDTHVWVDPGTLRITGIVDFGERAAGDRLWDFIEFEPGVVPALAEGYGLDAAARAELDDRLRLYRLIKAVPWASKWHERGEVQVISWLLWTLDDLP